MSYLIIAVLIFVIIVFIKKRNDGCSSRFNKRYSSQNDTYSIHGKKNHFEITKNNDVSFEVINGEIISVTNPKGEKYNY